MTQKRQKKRRKSPRKESECRHIWSILSRSCGSHRLAQNEFTTSPGKSVNLLLCWAIFAPFFVVTLRAEMGLMAVNVVKCTQRKWSHAVEGEKNNAIHLDRNRASIH